jgi:hypothetical protein
VSTDKKRIVAEIIHAEAKRMGARFVLFVTFAEAAESVFFFPTKKEAETFGRALEAKLPDVTLNAFEVKDNI